jgi:integrase
VKLTQRRIEGLECPRDKKDILVFDDEQAGLGVRVTSGGGKWYLAQYRRAGEKRRVPLGSCSAISLAVAREAARALMGDVAKGRAPAAERKETAKKEKEQAERESLTFGVLIDQWGERHLAGRRPGYAAEATRALRFAFAKQLKEPAGALEAKVVRRTINTIADADKKATARLTMAYGRACYAWAAGRDLVPANPFGGIKTEAVPARDRVLSDAELRAVCQATERPGAYNSIVSLLILTGQRRDEVAAMVWGELSPDLSTWTIPSSRTKNGLPHTVPLSEQAQAILRAVPRRSREPDDNGPDLVFSARGGPFAGWSKAKARLDEDVVGRLLKQTEEQRLDPGALRAPERWTLHDLRRTLATGLQKLGVRLEVTEAVLNHVSGSRAGIAGVYQRHSWADEKRAALDAWGAHVAALVEGREPQENVLPLSARAGAKTAN